MYAVNLIQLCSLFVLNQARTFEVIYEWVTVEYNWTDNSTKQAAIDDESYIVENCVITGLKLVDNRTFVTVPRWREGVPSTLNEVKVDSNGNPLLNPYPSWQYNTIDDCDAFQNVQSMEIDSDTGYMWILDTAHLYESTTNPNISVDASCPPKLVIWDVVNNVSIYKYDFPNDVAQQNNTFLNDLVIDPINKIAYISDVLGTSSITGATGGIVTFNYKTKKSSRFVDDRINKLSMRYDSYNISNGQNIDINGYKITVQVSADGIALSPDCKYLYYCALNSYRTWRIPTSVLNSMEITSNTYSNNNIEFVGWRQSQMDGMTFDNNSVLYMGSLNRTSLDYIQFYDISDSSKYNQSKEMIYVQDSTQLQWIDTLAWTDGYLYFTSNRLHRYFLNNMDWTGGEGANMRVVRVKTDSSSYQMYCLQHDCTSSSGSTNETTVVIIIAIIAVAAMICICLGVVYITRRNKGDNKKGPLLSSQDYNAM